MIAMNKIKTLILIGPENGGAYKPPCPFVQMKRKGISKIFTN